MSELTLNKMIYQVYESLNISSDDTSLDRRFINDIIEQWRAAFIRREANKNRSIDDNIIQRICIDLVVVSRYGECPDVPEGCKILRSKDKLPNAVELNFDKTITKVSSKDILARNITLMDYDSAPYWGNSRFNTKSIGSFLKSNYLYIFSKGDISTFLIDKLDVDGVWESPIAAEKYCECDGSPCFSPDDNYPMNMWMWEQLVKPEVLKQCSVKRTANMDESNNAQDNSVPQAQVTQK